MKVVTAPMLAATFFCLITCNRSGDGKPTSEDLRNRPPSELTPIELSELTGNLLDEEFEKTGFEGTAFWESKDWHEIEAAHGAAFKKHLIETIQGSASITIEEHSYPGDSPLDSENFMDTPRFTYRSKTLSDEQVDSFLESAKAMAETSVLMTPSCYSPHHRMEFVDRKGRRSSMEICFQCGKVEWDLCLSHPEGLFKVLTEVVEGAGLETERNWQALSEESRKQSPAGID